MILSIDVESAMALAAAWTQLADAVADTQIEVERTIDMLEIGGPDRPATRALCNAAVTLWRTSTYVADVVTQVVDADGVDLARSSSAAELDAPIRYTPGNGDMRGAYTSEARGVAIASGDTDHEIGRRLVVQATHDTASTAAIRPDEIQFSRLENGSVLIVLPGVIDLSEWVARLAALEPPPVGHSSENGSVRDLDQGAVDSFFSTGLASNSYAVMVAEAVRRLGIEPGTELFIAGHSYGADTAVDLAADPEFNGPDGYRVSHVLAMAYDSERQLDDVPGRTNVLVVQNANDRVVDAEKLIPTSAGGAFWGPDTPLGVLTDPLASMAAIRGSHHGRSEHDGSVDGIVVFDGGSEGQGHHQSNYIEFLEHTDLPEAVAFFGSLGAAASNPANPAVPSATTTSRKRMVHTKRAVDVSVSS